MRFRLEIELKDGIKLIPINYQWYLSSWIYHTLASSDKEFTEWLHSQGYPLGEKYFKLFTFSRLQFEKCEQRADLLVTTDNKATLCFSSLMPEIATHFVAGLFKDRLFEIRDARFTTTGSVSQVIKLPEPAWTETMPYTLLTPAVISKSRGVGLPAEYLTPGHPEYGSRLIQNLRNKAQALSIEIDENLPTRLQVKGQPRKNGITIKSGKEAETKVIGYRFAFEMEAPIALHQIGYYGGFGEKNSLGFGCGEVMDKIN